MRILITGGAGFIGCSLMGTSHPARHEPARRSEQRRSSLDAGLLRGTVGWSPSTSLRDGLAQTLSHFRAAHSRRESS